MFLMLKDLKRENMQLRSIFFMTSKTSHRVTMLTKQSVAMPVPEIFG